MEIWVKISIGVWGIYFELCDFSGLVFWHTNQRAMVFLLYLLQNFWADFCYTWQFLEKFVILSFVILRNFQNILLYLIGYT